MGPFAASHDPHRGYKVRSEVAGWLTGVPPYVGIGRKRAVKTKLSIIDLFYIMLASELVRAQNSTITLYDHQNVGLAGVVSSFFLTQSFPGL